MSIKNSSLKFSKERSTTGYNKKLSMKEVKKDVKMYFSSNRVVHKWNKLRKETINADNTKNF